MMSSRFGSGELDSLLVRLAAFAASLVFLGVAVIDSRVSEAMHDVTAWRIYPGIDQEEGVLEFGMHFDESDEWFGARDYNHDDDGTGMAVYLRTEVYSDGDMPFPIRYNRAVIPGS